MPIEMSGIYAQVYADTYPEDVEAIIGINTGVMKQIQEIEKAQRLMPEDYQRRTRKTANIQYYKQKIINICGYSKLQWPV